MSQQKYEVSNKNFLLRDRKRRTACGGGGGVPVQSSGKGIARVQSKGYPQTGPRSDGTRGYPMDRTSDRTRGYPPPCGQTPVKTQPPVVLRTRDVKYRKWTDCRAFQK